MSRSKVALVMDFDDTLAHDTTSKIVELCGENADRFWESLKPKFQAGWDPPLAWIPALIDLCAAKGQPLTRDSIQQLGHRMRLHDGIPDFFNRLGEHVTRRAQEERLDVKLESYVISGGIEELILATPVSPPVVTEVYGCTLDYDEGGRAIGPRSIVSFTEKTKFLFAINKGVAKEALRHDAGVVNNFVPRSMRPVPFEQMIYVGDGPTDVPCFSVVTQSRGSAVGVRGSRTDRGVSYPDKFEFRPRWGPFQPDYTEQSDLSKIIVDLVNGIIRKMASGGAE